MSHDLPYRGSIRLSGFDYSSPNSYYVTICTEDRKNLFGDIVNSIHVGANLHAQAGHDSPVMQLNPSGEILQSILLSLPNRFPINIDTFQIMPNHVHLIINILRAHHDAPLQNHLQKRSLLSQIVGYSKMNSTKKIRQLVGAHHDAPVYESPDIRIWQRNYYEHIIRDEGELRHIRKYIADNPKNWATDKLYVGANHDSPAKSK